MADIIKVDTDHVAAAAKNIASYNRKINADFSAVENAIRALSNEWISSAATHAISSFYEIKDAYFEARYDVVHNYVKFLHQQVEDGYEMIENNNEYLAKLFK